MQATLGGKLCTAELGALSSVLWILTYTLGLLNYRCDLLEKHPVGF